MLTIDRQLKNKATFIELKSATSIRQREGILQNLGGNIKACITRLKKLIVEIQSETDVRKISQKMSEYEKVNREYNKLQQSLGEIDENSQLYDKIVQMNKQFIETYEPQQLKKKLNHMAAERNQHIRNTNLNEINYFNHQESLQGELLYEDKYAVRRRILEQEKIELKELERLITQVNQIAKETQIMINRQGQIIRLGLEKMKKANENLKDGKENLFQTNEYQQDTNKKFMIFCCLTVVIVSIVVLIVYSSSGRT